MFARGSRIPGMLKRYASQLLPGLLRTQPVVVADPNGNRKQRRKARRQRLPVPVEYLVRNPVSGASLALRGITSEGAHAPECDCTCTGICVCRAWGDDAAG